MPNFKVYKDFKLYINGNMPGVLFYFRHLLKNDIYDIHVVMCSYSSFNATDKYSMF